MKRTDFLANASRQIAATHLPDARAQRPLSPALPPFVPADLAAPFSAEATALKCEVHSADSPAATIEHIDRLFEAHQAAEFLSWDEAALPVPGLLRHLAGRGLSRRHSAVSNHPQARRDTQAGLSEVKIGLTGALAGLADTGSLVLQSHHGQGRLASLMPPVHIALLRAGALFPSMAHFVQAHPNALRNASNLVLVSGPSRTADIEQTLTLGVHGPKEVHIVLLRYA